MLEKIIVLAILVAVGLLIYWLGMATAVSKLENKSSGKLRIDNSDPDQTYVFLELSSKDPSQFKNGQYITLQVDVDH